jgi:toxin ParE1/3/4
VKRLKLTPMAHQDLKDIGDYIAQDNLNAALSFVHRLKERCLALAHNPGIGRKRDDISPSVRSAAEGNYLIVYRQVTNNIEVLRIIHGMRDISRIVLPIES